MALLMKEFSLFAITIFVHLNVEPSNGLRILGLFPFQVHSHFVMCEELMIGLAAKGHRVDVYSHFPQKKPLPNYTDFSLKGTLPAVSNNMTFEVASIVNGAEMLKYWIETHGKSVCGLLGHPLFQKLLYDPPTDPPYDIVITELSVSHCYIPWGHHLNIPVVGVVTPPLLDWHFEPLGTPLNLANDPSIFSSYVAPMTFFERLDNLYIHYTIKSAFQKYTQDQNELVEKYFGPGFPPAMDMMKEVSLVLVNHDSSLSGIRPFAPIVVPVGGLHVVDHNATIPQVVRKWLDDSTNGCIYFSFGSMTRIETFPRHIIDAFYKSFENIKPVNVLLKIAKPEELPPGLPSNVLTQPWFQQKQVLKHKNVKAFVTHGGLMGTQEAIYFGVPLVAVPLFGDQRFNAKAYAKRNIAIYVEVEKITEKSFTHALNEVLRNPLYMKTVQKLSREFRDRPMTPIQTASFWIEYIVRHGKDALRSPIVDMPWWQVSLLDVYGFIVFLVLLVLYVSAKILKILSGLLWVKTNTSSKVKKN